jgi:hypothetical protein
MSYFDPSNCNGVLRGKRPFLRSPSMPGLTDEQPESVTRWRYSLPADSQGNYGACVGFGTANCFEDRIKEADPSFFKDGWQIDGLKLWRDARDDYHGGKYDGGLLLDEAFKAGLKRGLFPEGATLREIGANLREITDALRIGALILGFNVSQGWASGKVHPENGSIPEGYMIDFFAGHCVAGKSAWPQAGLWMTGFQNSWPGWGRHGFGCMSWHQFELSLMTPPLLIVLPEGWTNHKIPDEYLTKREAA